MNDRPVELPPQSRAPSALFTASSTELHASAETAHDGVLLSRVSFALVKWATIVADTDPSDPLVPVVLGDAMRCARVMTAGVLTRRLAHLDVGDPLHSDEALELAIADVWPLYREALT